MSKARHLLAATPLVLALSAPAAALADDDVGTSLDLVRDRHLDAQPPEITGFGFSSKPFVLQLDAQAFGGVDLDRPVAGVGASLRLAYVGPACALVDLGAHATFARATAGGADGLSGEAWLSGCVSMSASDERSAGHTFILRLEDRARLDVEPALTSRRVVLTGRHSANLVTIEMLGPRGNLYSGDRLRIFDVRARPGFYWDPSDPAAGTQMTMDVEIELGQWHRERAGHGFGIGAIYVEDHWSGMGADVRGGRVAFARLLGLRLGGALLDLWPAWGNGAVYEPWAPDRPLAHIHHVDVLAGRAALRPRTPGRLGWEVSLDRNLWPTLEHDLVVDTRATAAFSYQRGAWSADGSAFLADTATYTDEGPVTTDLGVGGDFRVARRLPRGLNLALAVEGVTAPEPAWRSYLTVGFAWGVNTSPPAAAPGVR